MTVPDKGFLEEYRKQILDEHVKVGHHKPVSYLPIRTIEKVLGLMVSDYKSKIEQAGNKCAVFSSEESCIESGAVFAFNTAGLDAIIRDNFDLLTRYGWPTSADEFVARIAMEWLDKDNPVIYVVRAAFGDTPDSFRLS